MKAAIYHEPGSPDVLRYEDVQDPAQPARGEILIRVEAISIEGGDLLGRQRVAAASPPRAGGYAAAGEVIALGADVSHFKVGQKVATFAFGGSHAELRVVPAATSWAVPEGLDIKLAATVPCGPGTAELALELGCLKPGQTVLIQGAAGGVGVAAVQLARRMGARVLGTGSSADSLDKLRAYGLSDALVISQRPVNDQVRELLNGEGVDLLIDNVGGPELIAGLAAVKDGGRAVLVGVFGGMEYSIDAFHLLAHRQTVTGCFLGPVMADPSVHRMISGLLDQAARGEFQVPIDAVYPLSEAAAAHRRAEQRGRIGRVIITP